MKVEKLILALGAIVTCAGCSGLGYANVELDMDCYAGGVTTGGKIWECEISVCESGLCGGYYTPIGEYYVAAEDGNACFMQNNPYSNELSTRVDCRFIGYWKEPNEFNKNSYNYSKN